MQAGLAEIQKNIAMLTSLTEPLQIVDKRRKQIIATVYPRLATHNAKRLAGKYRTRIPAILHNVSFEEARETAFRAAMKEKYGAAD
jgi:hypothetical protein